MGHGGARNGAGKPKGTVWNSTLEKRAVQAEIAQRVLRNADKLFNAQLATAVGSVQIFKAVKVGNAVKHFLVNDPDEITQVLDAGHGANCSVNGSFYAVVPVPPENRAIDSMLDRTFGKAAQSLEITTDPQLTDLKNRIQSRAEQMGRTYKEELQLVLEQHPDLIPPGMQPQLEGELVN